VAIGSVMRALAVGEIVESRHPDYRAGEIVTGWFGWQEFATIDGGAVIRRVLETDLPHSRALGVLGLNGVTALIGLTVIGEPKPGETVLVSTAAGAVGSAVGQVAKILGCRAVGIAGGENKVAQYPTTQLGPVWRPPPNVPAEQPTRLRAGDRKRPLAAPLAAIAACSPVRGDRPRIQLQFSSGAQPM
jgi:NADPH-dependent curcumin reductase CurA